NLLDLSKVKANEVKVMESHFSLRELATGLEQTYRPLAQRKKLTFEFIVRAACPVYIVSDEAKIHQVLVHLLDNAFKFTTSGKISVLMAHTTVDDTDWLQFDVIDTGRGVSKPIQSRL